VSAREQLAALYQELGRRGMIQGRSGNASLRTPAGMIITPSGGAPDAFTPAGLVAMDGAGRAESEGVPSSEWLMHARIYQAFAHAGCIVHTHSDACTALACLGEFLPAFHYMIAAFGGDDVRCAPYVTFGTPALAEAAVQALHGRSACLLANHGVIVYAWSAQQALSDALLLESLVRQYLLARSAGTVRLLTPEEMRDARDRFRRYNAGRG
jgi:L-fuculose-phosphate aldolase